MFVFIWKEGKKLKKMSDLSKYVLMESKPNVKPGDAMLDELYCAVLEFVLRFDLFLSP